MRIRRLQRQGEQGQWYDDAYALEEGYGQVVFHYNLTWDRVGSTYNGKLQESGVSLDAIDTVLQPGEKFRWLPIEVITDGEADTFLDALNEQCAIPRPKNVTLAVPVSAD